MRLPIYSEPRRPSAGCPEGGAPGPALRPAHPGSTGTYYIHTWGCQMNFHDSEKLAGQLESLGYAEAEDDAEADVVLLNTCSVREKADEKAFALLGRLRRLKERKPTAVIGVCGCVAQQLKRAFFRRAPHLDMVLGPQAVHHLPRHLELVRRRRTRVLDTVQHRSFQDYAGPSLRRGEPPKAWVTVQEGCDKFCTYCIIPHTRGREANRPYASVLDEVAALARAGYVEVELLGQNVNCWSGEDPRGRRRNFADLLLAVAEVEGIDRVRFITSHPSHFTDRIVSAVASHPAICPHVHLPVQSGSTRVLQAMRRDYTREEFLRRVETLRAAVPEVAVSTDVIVGFLGEEEEDHRATLSLLEEVRFDFIYSFMYSPRPHTRAWKSEDTVSPDRKLRRLQEVQALQKEIQWDLQRACEGRVFDVLVDGTSRRDPGEVCGRTPQWRIVNFPGTASLRGRTVPVRIRRAHLNSLSGARVA